MTPRIVKHILTYTAAAAGISGSKSDIGRKIKFPWSDSTITIV